MRPLLCRLTHDLQIFSWPHVTTESTNQNFEFHHWSLARFSLQSVYCKHPTQYSFTDDWWPVFPLFRWFGWSARASVHWIVPIIGSGIFGFGACPSFRSSCPGHTDLVWCSYDDQLVSSSLYPIMIQYSTPPPSLPILLYLVDAFTFAASAVAAASTFRSLLGFAFPLFGSQMFNKLTVGWGCTVCFLLPSQCLERTKFNFYSVA
jgi:hypothetical protein